MKGGSVRGIANSIEEEIPHGGQILWKEHTEARGRSESKCNAYVGVTLNIWGATGGQDNRKEIEASSVEGVRTVKLR